MSDAGLDWMARNVNDFASHFLQRYEKQGSLREGLMYAFNRTFQGVPASPVTAKEAANWPECRAPAEADTAADPRLVREFKLEAELAASQERVKELERLVVANQASRQFHAEHAEASLNMLRQAESSLKIAEAKNRTSLANNLCPDHRDKQVGKPCLACEIERKERERDALAKDAERYRFLRDKGIDVWPSSKCLLVYQGITSDCSLLPDELDTAIDAALISGSDAT